MGFWRNVFRKKHREEPKEVPPAPKEESDIRFDDEPIESIKRGL